MAAVLDITIICDNVLQVNIIERMLVDYNTSLDLICSAENWLFDNEETVDSLHCIEDLLNNGLVIDLKLKNELVKDLGVFIEKIDDYYFYNLWINTENYPNIDCDAINCGNRVFYDEIYRAIVNTSEIDKHFFRAIAVGVEMDINYEKNLNYTMQNSRNVTAWIVNDGVLDDEIVKKYTMKTLKGSGIRIFERIKL